MATDDERIKNIYKIYIEDICPFIIQIEILANRFPAEILNEIRAIFTHLSKYNLSDDISIKERNLSKAEGHLKRSKLDCYKYICTAYEDEYSNFDKMYKDIDLSFIDNGEFLQKLLEARNNARQLLLEARKTDLSIYSDDETNTEKSYEKYEKAFVTYSSVYNLITDSYKKLENLKRKAVTKSKKHFNYFIIGLIVGIIGVIVGILGVIF